MKILINKKKLVKLIDELQRDWIYIVELKLNKLDACGKVIEHLSVAEPECPVEVYCGDCEYKGDCKFFATAPGRPEDCVGKNEREWHIEVILAWSFIRDLEKLKEFLNA